MIVPAYGTVTAQPEGWHGDNAITRDDSHTAVIGRKWLFKVPEGRQALGGSGQPAYWWRFRSCQDSNPAMRSRSAGFQICFAISR